MLLGNIDFTSQNKEPEEEEAGQSAETRSFIARNKWKILGGGLIVFSVGALAYFGVRNPEAVNEGLKAAEGFLDGSAPTVHSALREKAATLFAPSKYSSRWFRSLTDQEWGAEREIVRLKHCSGDSRAYHLLELFDKEWYRRKDDGKPWIPPKHSEHGWYLTGD